jgi:hypothetical protein
MTYFNAVVSCGLVHPTVSNFMNAFCESMISAVCCETAFPEISSHLLL